MLSYPSSVTMRFCDSVREVIELIAELRQNLKSEYALSIVGAAYGQPEFGPHDGAFTSALGALREGLYDYEKSLPWEVPRAEKADGLGQSDGGPVHCGLRKYYSHYGLESDSLPRGDEGADSS